MALYRDRTAAGQTLAETVAARLASGPRPVVLGLVRGGMPVAAVLARWLAAPLDVLVVRKLGVPWAPEVAFGALGAGGIHVLNEDIAGRLRRSDIAAVVQREATELARREQAYRAGREPIALSRRTALIVDDGLATGATARAAVAVARRSGASRVVVAVPVGAPEAVALLAGEADEVICPHVPADFGAVSRFYDDFRQVSDAEVTDLLGVTPA